jgi:hypothetical protein
MNNNSSLHIRFLEVWNVDGQVILTDIGEITTRVTKIIKKDTGHDARGDTHTHAHNTHSLSLTKKSLWQAWSMFWSLSVHLLQRNTLFQNYISGREQLRKGKKLGTFSFFKLWNIGSISPTHWRKTQLSW